MEAFAKKIKLLLNSDIYVISGNINECDLIFSGINIGGRNSVRKRSGSKAESGKAKKNNSNSANP